MRKDRDVNYLVAMDLRGVWRYQRGNQNLYIEEEQTTQCQKENYKRTNNVILLVAKKPGFCQFTLLFLKITLQCSRHSTLGKNTKQTFILLFKKKTTKGQTMTYKTYI
jgi:hypothetical protein